MSQRGVSRRVGAYLLVLLLAVLLGLWGAFFVPLRIAGFPVPLGLLGALAMVPLITAGGTVAGSRVGALGPWLCWLATVLALASRRREGDLVITSGVYQLAFLLVGVLGGAAAIGLWRPASQRPAPPSPGTSPSAGPSPAKANSRHNRHGAGRDTLAR